ncbi:hypothetical protein BTO30_01450 [Domibacillus antri]|uniref:SLH domain-containing protein n=1 Tax=Domibacillus antri TaxID=1714264 RepID=A0A1Q8QA72_9BACI|nr:hypothetical protein BTO30_01450 [Domibacillus antri]
MPQAQAETVHSFKDVSANYDEAVSFLYEFEIIKGVSSTEFGTYKPLTRGDAAVILANTLFLDTESAPDAGFTDVNSRIKGSVNALAEAGIISGVTSTEFKPNDTLSRGAMAKLLTLGFELQDYAVDTPFKDASGVFKPYINALYGAEITSGKSKDTYGTQLDITRGDFSNLLYRTILFADELYYFPVIGSYNLTSPTSIDITLTEAVPEEWNAKETVEFLQFSVQLKDGTETIFDPTAYRLSQDRKTVTVEHTTYDLTGKEGTLFIDDFENVIEIPFNFTTAAAADASLQKSLQNMPATTGTAQ